jgi:hypothetical protein
VRKKIILNGIRNELAFLEKSETFFKVLNEEWKKKSKLPPVLFQQQRSLTGTSHKKLWTSIWRASK